MVALHCQYPTTISKKHQKNAKIQPVSKAQTETPNFYTKKF
jgi:hypothetical protein